MKNILYKISIILLVFSVSCTEDVEFSSDTEALNDFSIAEGSASNYVLNSGTPENTIELNWNKAIPGVSKTPTYKVLFFKAGLETPEFVSFPSNNDGKDNMLTITFANIDEALSAAGYEAGETAELQWQVVATNGDVEVSTSKNNIEFVRFSTNGIKNFNLLLPSNNKVIKADIYGEPNGEVTFSWEAAATTTGSGTIVYTLLFDELGGNFSDPLKSFPIASGTSFTMTNTQIGEEFADAKHVIWTVNAKISDDVSELKAEKQFLNWDVFVINELYLVGSHNGWNNATAHAFKSNGKGGFELQIDLSANDEFKFLPTLGTYDGDWGEDPSNPGKLIQNGEQNLKVLNTSTYIITVDFPTLSITVKEFTAPDNLFMVGSINGWNNATALPFYNDGNGVFSLTYTFSVNDEFKFLPTLGTYDGDWGEDPDNAGGLIQDGEQNIKITTAGKYVVIVDFNKQTIKVTAINNLYSVGSQNSWNNADATQKFNTTGNGVFVRVQTFEAGAEFKLLPESGTYDGDWGKDPDNAGKLVQDGESNIPVAVAGTYMINVDFNTLSYTVTQIPDNLFLVGSPVGWNASNAISFTKLSQGVFELSTALTASDEFKFLPTLGAFDNDWGASKKYNDMIIRDDENNIASPGTGTYTITVNFNKGTYIIN
ncbi:SusF/SusE family outer membrane protein [Mariniflexile litorale]|uniref:SusF/SusE family outer membrane protein n=1 Tax=Mariniflexile litorale TaxID=3045158 RepID=A0AAU7EJ04_9FLAO|nr:SusF/SusE family outer membrane protein [Mariniflexile sp. KMM 9835]MDQ8210701.1 SusF/SusE family outer membrane protein [Mariniflexile sp. KMM 9835]